MCLNSVSSNETEKITGYGWKIFQRTKNNRLKPAAMSCLGCHTMERKLTAESSPLWVRVSINGKPIMACKSYMSGFHIFKSKAAAFEVMQDHFVKEYWLTLHKKNLFVVRRVKYETVLARGRQYGKHVIVARHMTILRDKVEPVWKSA